MLFHGLGWAVVEAGTHAGGVHHAPCVALVRAVECDVVRKAVVLFCPADDLGDAHTMLLLSDAPDDTGLHFDILLVDGVFENIAGCPVHTRCVGCDLLTADENPCVFKQVQYIWRTRI